LIAGVRGEEEYEVRIIARIRIGGGMARA